MTIRDMSINNFPNNNLSLEFDDIVTDFLKIIVTSKFKDMLAIKGAVSLRETAKDYDYQDVMRITADLDMDWKTKSHADWEIFVKEIEDTANKNSELGLNYKIIKRRGFAKNKDSDTLTFKVLQNDSEATFSIDVNLNSKAISFDSKNIGDVSIDMYPIGYMIADKMKVIATEKVYRRTKDLIDLYIISNLADFHYNQIYNKVWEKLVDEEFSTLFFINRCDKDKLEHAYNKLERVNFKPHLNEVVERVASFTAPLYHYSKNANMWDKSLGMWI